MQDSKPAEWRGGMGQRTIVENERVTLETSAGQRRHANPRGDQC